MIDGNGLPKGWVVARLDEIAGIAANRKVADLSAETQVNFVPMAAVKEEFGGIDTSTMRTLAEVQKGYTQFQEGDVLLAKITPCMENGKVAVVPPLATACGYGSTEFHVLRPHNVVLPVMLAHFLSQKTFRRDSQRNMSGSAGQLRVPKPWLQKQKMPVAPLKEQRRIVAKIEELFSDLDAGVAALERVKAKLKRYRAAVLKAAVEGKLTEAWRKKNRPKETGRQLLDRILAERRSKWEADQLAAFEKAGKKPPAGWKDKYKEPVGRDESGLRELPGGWCWATVGQLLNGIEAGKSFECQKRQAAIDEWGIIKVSAMTWGEFLEGENKAIPFNADFDSDSEIRSGDVLLSRSNTVELVGATVLVKQCRPKLLLSDKSMRLLINPAINRFWFQKSMSSRIAREQLSAMATGTSDSMRNVSQEKVTLVSLPVPPPTEQAQIVEELEMRLSGIDAVVSLIAANLERSARLRQSILKRAFEGKLVPQDPNDEPATLLLERIRPSDDSEKNAKPRTRRSPRHQRETDHEQ